MSPLVDTGDVSLFYETFGDGDVTLVLIAGRGGQLTDWHDELVTQFVRLGFRVVRFDNRDSGLSTHIDGVEPDLLSIFKGVEKSPYSLDDMADDVASLLRSLSIERAIVVAMSLGGMVAQCLAVRCPELVSGMVLLSTSSSAPGVGQPSAEVLQSMFAAASDSPTEVVDPLEAAVASSSRWTSWKLGVTPEALRSRMKARIDRRYDLSGIKRQMAAVLSAPDRTEALQSLKVPTVVLHGKDDPLVHPSGGEAVAHAIPDAELLLIDDLGHDLPRAIWPIVIDAVERVKSRL